MTPFRSLLGALACGFLAIAQAQAADPTVATVAYLKGELRENGRIVVQGAQVASGSTLTTGDGAQARLQFADRSVVILDQNTTFWFADFQEGVEGNWQRRVRFTLDGGAMRAITGGAVSQEAPGAAVLHTPQASFNVRGTDYLVAVVNPTYLSVVSGSVAVSNAGGSVLYSQGMYGEVVNSTTVGYAIREQDVPPATRSAFVRLLESQTAAAAAPAAEAVSSGLDTTTLILLGVGAAVLGMAAGGSSSSATSH